MSFANAQIAGTDPDAVVTRFRRLIREIEEGGTKRNAFQPWEIDLLLDIQACQLPRTGRRALLDRYQRAVCRQVENGARAMLKLSEYMDRSTQRRAVS